MNQAVDQHTRTTPGAASRNCAHGAGTRLHDGVNADDEVQLGRRTGLHGTCSRRQG